MAVTVLGLGMAWTGGLAAAPKPPRQDLPVQQSPPRSPLLRRLERPRLIAELNHRSSMARDPVGLESIIGGRNAPGWPTSLEFEPGGHRLLATDHHGRVFLLEPRELEGTTIVSRVLPPRVIRLSTGPGYFSAAAFSDPRTVVTTDGTRGEGLVRAWDARTGSHLATFGLPRPEGERRGRVPVLWTGDGGGSSAHVWLPRAPVDPRAARAGQVALLHRMERGREVGIVAAPARFCTVLFNDTRSLLVVVTTDRAGPPEPDLSFSPFPSCHQPGRKTVSIYDARSGQRRSTLSLDGEGAMALQAPDHGRFIVIQPLGPAPRYERLGVHVFGTSDGRLLGTLPDHVVHEHSRHDGAGEVASADGRWLLVVPRADADRERAGSDRRPVRRLLWDVKGWRAGLQLEADVFDHVAFVPGSSRLLVKRRGQPPQLIDPATGVSVTLHVGQLFAPRAQVAEELGLVALWDSSHLACGTGGYHPFGARGDRTVRLVDLASGKVVASLGDHPAPVALLRFSTDRQLAATIDVDANLRVFRLAVSATPR